MKGKNFIAREGNTYRVSRDGSLLTSILFGEEDYGVSGVDERDIIAILDNRIRHTSNDDDIRGKLKEIHELLSIRYA